ncbi:VF530 family DNA-binding protein [Deinococcus sp.]|uniref:VF530 family protein n=1 Tax=Deinococcus sp. TaxID=47478 RepID=UPI003C7DA990
MTTPDPLHGVTLQQIVERLQGYYGWKELSRRVRLRCFEDNPSVGSSLKFLRKTPWARAKVEELYLFMLRKHPDALEKTSAPTDSQP